MPYMPSWYLNRKIEKKEDIAIMNKIEKAKLFASLYIFPFFICIPLKLEINKLLRVKFRTIYAEYKDK